MVARVETTGVGGVDEYRLLNAEEAHRDLFRLAQRDRPRAPAPPVALCVPLSDDGVPEFNPRISARSGGIDAASIAALPSTAQALWLFPLTVPEPRSLPRGRVSWQSMAVAVAFLANMFVAAIVVGIGPSSPTLVVERVAAVPALAIDRAPVPAPQQHVASVTGRVKATPVAEVEATATVNGTSASKVAVASATPRHASKPVAKPKPIAASSKPSVTGPDPVGSATPPATAPATASNEATPPTELPGDLSAECLIDPAACSLARSPEPSAPQAPPVTASLPDTLTPAAMRPIITDAKARARACTTGATAPSDPITVKLSVAGSSGRVVSSEALGTHANTTVGRCVAAAFDAATFPHFKRPQIGVQVRVQL